MRSSRQDASTDMQSVALCGKQTASTYIQYVRIFSASLLYFFSASLLSHLWIVPSLMIAVQAKVTCCYII